MRHLLSFMFILLVLGIITGVITQDMTALDIENKISNIIENFFENVTSLSVFGQTAFELFQKAAKALTSFWDIVKGWFKWRIFTIGI